MTVATSFDIHASAEFLQDKVAKWWLSDVVFREEFPKKSVGKFSMKEFRAQSEDYTLPAG